MNQDMVGSSSPQVSGSDSETVRACGGEGSVILHSHKAWGDEE